MAESYYARLGRELSDKVRALIYRRDVLGLDVEDALDQLLEVVERG